MPIYQIILIIAIVILVLSLLLNLLFSPITWIIVGILVLYSFVRRYFYEKQIKEYNEKIEKKWQKRKQLINLEKLIVEVVKISLM